MIVQYSSNSDFNSDLTVLLTENDRVRSRAASYSEGTFKTPLF